jgi:flagellar protein FlaJ
MIEKVAIRLFGDISRPYLGYFESLRGSLKTADIKIPLHEYVSTMLLVSVVSWVLFMLIGTVMITYSLIYTAYSYTLAILLSFPFAGGVFFASYYYPNLKAKSVKTQIDRSLPFAVFYMATSASSGVNPTQIFKMLAERGGPIGVEAKKIYNDVVTMGMNVSDAMQKAATRSPSPQFADLLWGMMSIITTGGNVEAYLRGKTRTFMAQYRRSLNDYAKQISMYTEIYITLVIIGSLFFIVLISIISPLTGGGTLFIQTFLVFFFIPLVSMGFIVLLKGISPSE